MTTAKPKRRAPRPAAPARGARKRLAGAGQRVSGALSTAGSSATRLLDRLPATVRATRIGMESTTTALQALPDSTLRWIAATSVGLGAGLRLAGAPRLVSAAGAAPALLVGMAIALRPPKPPPPGPAPPPGAPGGGAAPPPRPAGAGGGGRGPPPGPPPPALPAHNHDEASPEGIADTTAEHEGAIGKAGSKPEGTPPASRGARQKA